MNTVASKPAAEAQPLAKARTGITGLDEVTFGGLPAGRPTLICGGPGCGKTLLATTFLVNGAVMFNEPGVFMSFEESGDDLIQNVASLGYRLDSLVAQKKIAIDFVRVERSEIEESGEYDLEGLFVRLDYAIKSVGANRVVLDTLEVLFAGLGDTQILRAEIRRLFAWLKERNVSAIITAEQGTGTLTRFGIEEYVSDCVAAR
jgi:circadian clock protein KaiC